jgi:hypothetical protein
MLQVTPTARAELRDMLDRAAPTGRARKLAEQRELGLRLVSTGRGALGLAIDRPRGGDAVIEHRERNVLLLDRGTSEQLDGLTLDVAETAEGRHLAIRWTRSARAPRRSRSSGRGGPRLDAAR